MAALSFEEARASVLREVSALARPLDTERISIFSAAGRVLAEDVRADRDYPAAPRSVRDGYAVIACEVPGALRVSGEVRAGEAFTGSVGPGEAVEIMTGAPLPPGADAIVMVEHTRREGDYVHVDRPAKSGDNISRQGGDAEAGQVVVTRGRRLGYAEIAMLATVGQVELSVYRKPRVAILTTGDEVVEITASALAHQVRNSNGISLAVQVARAGGDPEILPIAKDDKAATRELIERGFQADLLLLSGGVSAGKYDIVEPVLGELGARFFFDRVRIQPGQPLVFGAVAEKFFLGLPGNPGSTMVTFELFGRAALDLIGGSATAPLPLYWARLNKEFRQKPGLTRFLPAMMDEEGENVTAISWSGSGDVPALSRANVFLVTEEQREKWAAGDWIRVLAK